MKKPFIQLICLLFIGYFLSSCAQKGELLIHVKYKQPYCGGARPTPEILAEAEKEHDYPNAKFVLVSNKNKMIAVNSNAEGVIKIKIPYGDYILLEEWKFNRGTPGGESLDNFDKTCLESEWKKEIMKIDFSKTSSLPIKPSTIELTCPNSYPCLKTDNQIPQRE